MGTTSNVQRSTFNIQPKIPAGRRYDLEERLLDYAAAIIRLTERLPKTRSGNHVAGQLLRSGTSPLPNHGEGQAAESLEDFVHKFQICLKELRESRRWIRLIQRVPMIPSPEDATPLREETESLIRVFFASIRTAKQRHTPDQRPVRVDRPRRTTKRL